MVEWKKLGEVEDNDILTLGRGQVISKNDMNDCPGDYPVYSSSSQNNGEIGRYGKYMFDDERITWSIDGGGKLFYRNGIKYSVTNVCGWLKVNDENKLNTKFLYYLLFEEWTNIKFDYNHKAHPSVIRNEYIIPVIPLSEQTRIVGILDTFTSAIDNLKEQIAQRRKQYEYYRNQLLTFDKDKGARFDVKWMKLGEILDYEQPSKYIVSSKDYIEEGIPVLTAGQTFILGYTNEDKGIYRASKEKPVIIFDDFTTSFHWVTFDFKVKSSAIKMLRPINNNVDFRFIYYAMKCIKYETYDHARQWISKYSLFEIPIPPLSEQQRIVSILDTFEASIQNLEAQLDQREKQYEYYRNKLLTFE